MANGEITQVVRVDRPHRDGVRVRLVGGKWSVAGACGHWGVRQTIIRLLDECDFQEAEIDQLQKAIRAALKIRGRGADVRKILEEALKTPVYRGAFCGQCGSMLDSNFECWNCTGVMTK